VQEAGAVQEEVSSLPCIALIGTVVFRKGIREYLNIVRILRDKGVAFHAWVVGDIRTEDVREWCEEFIQSHKLDNIVTFLGLVDDMEKVYRGVTMLVHPSYEDSLPRVVMEAMAHGIPVVASTVGGIPEMVRNGEDGYLARYDDVEQFAEAVHGLLTNTDLRTRMGVQARRRATELFSKKQYETSMLNLYQSLL